MSEYDELLGVLDEAAKITRPLLHPDTPPSQEAADAIRTLLREREDAIAVACDIIKERDAARAEVERLRDVLSFAQHKLSMAKIWGGTGWHFNPLHPVHYLPALDKIDAALAGGRSDE